ALDLAKAGVHMVELPQTNARVAADQALYDAIVGQTLKHFDHPALNEHIANAVAIETARGFRLAKEKTRKKIDAAVALSMAHYGASQVAIAGPLPDRQPAQVSKWAAVDPRHPAERRFAGSRWKL